MKGSRGVARVSHAASRPPPPQDSVAQTLAVLDGEGVVSPFKVGERWAGAWHVYMYIRRWFLPSGLSDGAWHVYTYGVPTCLLLSQTLRGETHRVSRVSPFERGVIEFLVATARDIARDAVVEAPAGGANNNGDAQVATWGSSNHELVLFQVMEWDGMEWSGVEWNGVEWSGMEWNGVEWSVV